MSLYNSLLGKVDCLEKNTCVCRCFVILIVFYLAICSRSYCAVIQIRTANEIILCKQLLELCVINSKLRMFFSKQTTKRKYTLHFLAILRNCKTGIYSLNKYTWYRNIRQNIKKILIATQYNR